MEKFGDLTVFFPFYNEEANINDTVEEALEVISPLVSNLELLIINDGSSDRTGELATKLAEKHDNVRVINHEINMGYGTSLRSGFDNANYDYVFFSDGDRQFDLKEIPKLFSLIKDCDIAAGYRIKRSDPAHRLLNAKAYNIFVRILFGLKVKDIDCAFKLIKRDVLKSVTLKSRAAFISAELLIRAKKKGFTLKQTGVHHFPREEGTSTGNNPLVVIRSFQELFKLWKELR